MITRDNNQETGGDRRESVRALTLEECDISRAIHKYTSDEQAKARQASNGGFITIQQQQHGSQQKQQQQLNKQEEQQQQQQQPKQQQRQQLKQQHRKLSTLNGYRNWKELLLLEEIGQRCVCRQRGYDDQQSAFVVARLSSVPVCGPGEQRQMREETEI